MAEEMNQETGATGAASASGTGKLESSRTHARKAAEDLKTAASEMAGEYRGRAEQVLGRRLRPGADLPGRWRAIRAR